MMVQGKETTIEMNKKAKIMLFLKAKNIENPAPRFEKVSTSQNSLNLSFSYTFLLKVWPYRWNLFATALTKCLILVAFEHVQIDNLISFL